MRKVLIAQNGIDDAAATERARLLGNALAVASPHLEIDSVCVAPGVVFGLLDRKADVIVAVGYSPQELEALSVIAIPVIWDMALIAAAEIATWTEDPQSRASLSAALATARAYIDVQEDTALAIEDAFQVGVSTHGLAAALAIVARPMVVSMGTGLGNMIYAVPMLRWLSERYNTPIDLVIHDKFDEGVTMFARAPWINAVYPGYEYLVGRHYDLFISSVTAGAMRPPVSAKKILFVDQEHDYNEEGRFIHETRLNFLGLEKAFEEDPGLIPDLPLPFIRDINYRHSGKRIVGIANGKKSALWAKREWAHMEALTTLLAAKGWEVRSFGLPTEYVPGAQDFTGIPLRNMLHEIAECSYFISYDGGIAHMAEGIGVPTIWLFGSTGTVKNGPVYAHGRVLVSQRACGPCLYKHEWLRCTIPACMEDIRLEDVRDTLYKLEAEIAKHGYSSAPAQPDTNLLTYEIDALQRPGPTDLWQDNLAERLAILPRTGHQIVTLVLRLISAGDLIGAASLAKAQAAAGMGSVANRFLRHVIALSYDGPTPIDGLLPAELAPLTINDLSEVIELAFSREERRALLNLGVRLFALRQDRALASAFLSLAAGSVAFSREINRQIHRAMERIAHRDQPEAAPMLAAEFEVNPSLKRMRLIRATPVVERLAAVAASIAAPLNLDAEAVLDQSLAPHLSQIAASVPPVELELGQQSLILPHRSTVLVLVPHVMVKGALPGSTSTLLLLHMQRLAMIGLRPVAVTVGFDDIADGLATRDSVTYVQGHRLWPASEWAEVLQRFAPAALLAYGGVERDLDLPTEALEGMVRISLDGLYDLNGLFTEFTPSERWAPLPIEAHTPGTEVVSANVLTAQLFVPPARSRPAAPTPLTVVVILNDVRDFPALIRLVTIMPSVRFTVLTGLIHRGIEKNLRIVPPGELPDAEWAAAQLVLQFSTRPVSLSAEAVNWIERGGRCIAAPQSLPEGALAQALTSVGGKQDTLDWVAAIRSEAAGLARRATVILVD